MVEVLRPLLLGCRQALHALHAPLLHVLPLPFAVHSVYLCHRALITPEAVSIPHPSG